MQDINVWTGTGRLTRDAELKYTAGGMAICKFSIAVNRSVKKGESWESEASFFDCTLFGKYGEKMSQYLLKGKTVTVQGELRQERWATDDGQNRSKVGIIVESLNLGGGGSREGGQEPSAQSQGKDDDIPF